MKSDRVTRKNVESAGRYSRIDKVSPGYHRPLTKLSLNNLVLANQCVKAYALRNHKLPISECAMTHLIGKKKTTSQVTARISFHIDASTARIFTQLRRIAEFLIQITCSY